jgi:hypothetical protein
LFPSSSCFIYPTALKRFPFPKYVLLDAELGSSYTENLMFTQLIPVPCNDPVLDGAVVRRMCM